LVQQIYQLGQKLFSDFWIEYILFASFNFYQLLISFSIEWIALFLIKIK